MMALGFRHCANAIHEVERRFEIGKSKILDDVMFLDDFPIGQLLGVRNQLGSGQRRYAYAARHAMFFNQVIHWTSTPKPLRL